LFQKHGTFEWHQTNDFYSISSEQWQKAHVLFKLWVVVQLEHHRPRALKIREGWFWYWGLPLIWHNTSQCFADLLVSMYGEIRL